jgi:hypothetical protein
MMWLRRVAPMVVLAGMMAIAASAVAAPAKPAWSVTVVPYPTNFAPGSEGSSSGPNLFGPAYHIQAVNVGGAPTTGPFTITDALPSTLTPARAEGGVGSFGLEAGEHPLSCSRAGQTITCSGSSPAVAPGELIDVVIPVKLKSGGPKAYDDQVTVSGGGAAPATATAHSTVSETPAPFEILSGRAGLSSSMTEADGSAAVLAGSHPTQLNIGLGFSSELVSEGRSEGLILATGGGIRDLRATLPEGVVVNPQATEARCTEAELESAITIVGGVSGGCPAASQVGTVTLTIALAEEPTSAAVPLYNMVAPAGTPGVFGFEVVSGVYVHLVGSVRSDGSYELAAEANDALAKVPVLGAQTSLWGNPSDESHDPLRGLCAKIEPRNHGFTSCPVARTNQAFLTLPSACSGPVTTTVEVDSWLQPGSFVARRVSSTGLDDAPVGIVGCSDLQFNPSISLAPDQSNADSPTGLAVDLRVPQNEEFTKRAQATLEGAKVVLPPGFAVNPSAANGRTACTPAQIGLTTPVGQANAVRFTGDRSNCPDSSKVGSVEIDTPLLDHPIPGGVYLAQPYENPFGTLLALYIAVFDPQTGVVVKLPGKVEANPTTGQLTTTFAENPQLPFEDFKLSFFGGSRAALRTPATCGTHPAQSTLTPWSGSAAVSMTSGLAIDRGANGGPCANSPDQEPNQPAFSAGTTDPLAGAYSPFVLHLNREDGSQEFGALNVGLPPGLTGRLVGTPYCPEDALAAAAAKTGREEQASPSCPSASEVGQVTVGAGAGQTPFYATGRAYLAGPYKGAPLSLAIVTPAVAGPYDLGTVVVRSALEVDLETAQITVRSDPLPTILKGIPLDIRSIAVEVGKSQFTLNPTNCESMALGAEAISVLGNVARLSNRFQVGGCGKLAFKPKLKLSLKGGTKRAGHPALKAVVSYPKRGSYANIARAQVGLPHSEFLDQGNLNKVCKQADLKAGTCPTSSIYGHAKAWTPLLDKPLEGPVYLGVGFGYKLPALVADLNGQVRLLLVGRVDTTKRHGIRNTFEVVPDAPVSRFVLTMKGGKKYGLLENSENICRKAQRANARFVGQNGKVRQLHPKIRNSCKGKGKKAHKHRSHKRHRG